MNISAHFIRRPIATVLLTCGIAMAGIAAFFVLPISPLPQVDFPTISVSADLPGASPETMATSVATPLERRLGLIADVSEMTSSSRTGQTNVTYRRPSTPLASTCRRRFTPTRPTVSRIRLTRRS
jgi:multidrug efflux pump